MAISISQYERQSISAKKSQFNEAGTKLFGSGWVWLVRQQGQLNIITTSNQDSPISQGLYPIMGLFA